MAKKMLALVLATLMVLSIAGCTGPQEVWLSEEIVETVQKTQDGEKSTKTKKTTTAKETQNTQAEGSKVTRPSKNEADMLDFTPVEDAGANYDIEGTVSIAVDTVRPTDYEAMFDIMQKLYPNIKFEFDYWQHSQYDDAREYLSTRMKTNTAANIIWDEAGPLPTYLSQGWIAPITDYVNKDPEAKNIPANIKNDYTYYGELFAVPHQATFEVTVFNTDLLPKINMDLPKLEWSFDDYQKYLRTAGEFFNQGICVALEDQTETRERIIYYVASESGDRYGAKTYNYKTQEFNANALKTGYKMMREFRLIPGAEGWQQQQSETAGTNLLQQKLGVTNYYDCWRTGKALMKDCGTWVVETSMKNYKFNWKMWTMPNQDGKMMMHVDHCFITKSTPADRMDACYQVLRFMTFTTNGNLARLTMYEDSQEGKYNLNSHIFYPTTTSKEVAKKFNDLTCTNEVDEYLVKNISNCGRADSFKLVPSVEEVYTSQDWIDAMNEITDGKDTSGAGLDEPIVKANKKIKENFADFKKDFDKNYK